jgi:4-hydroxy-2-oxoglutarate aldolase
MTSHRERLRGVFAPVVTPFRNDEILLDALRDNLRRLGETDLAGYLALGSNGEFRSLTAREQVDVLEVFADEKRDKVVMVGTGCESTRETIERSAAAASMGFAYASVLTPGYFPKHMDGRALHDHYERIAEAVPIPIVLYNAPGFTGGVHIPPATVCALARHPNIAGMKDSSPAGPARFLSRLDPADDFAVLAGSANFFLPALHLGAPGGVVSLANALPDPCCRLYRLFTEGAFDEARALSFRLARLNQAVSGRWGVAGVKAAMELTGLVGGEPRSPLGPVPREAREEMRKAFRAEGFLTD